MAGATTNLGLVLPLGGENVSRTVINSNNEIIDGVVGPIPAGKTLQGQISTLEQGSGTIPSGKTLQGEIDDLSEDVAGLQTDVSDIQDNIGDTALPTSAQTLTGAIAENSEEIALKANADNVWNAEKSQQMYDDLDVRKVNTDNIYEYKDVQGSSVTVTDAAEAYVRQMMIEIKTEQDLHGFDHQWAGGTGKNILPMVLSDIKAANTEGTWDGNSYALNGRTVTVDTDSDDNVLSITITGTFATGDVTFALSTHTYAAGTYILSGAPSGNATYISDSGDISDTGSGATFTLSEATEKTFSITVLSGLRPISPLVFYPMIRDSSASADFEPYSNLCPVPRRTKCIVSHQKHGFYSNEGVEAYDSDATVDITGTNSLEVTASGTYAASKQDLDYYELVEGKEYIIYAHARSVIPVYAATEQIAIRNSSGLIIHSATPVSGGDITLSFRYNPDTDKILSFYATENNSHGVVAYTNISIHPIDEYTEEFPEEVCPVCGGVLRVDEGRTGMLTVNVAVIEPYNGEELPEIWMSDRDVYEAGTTPSIGAQVVYALDEPVDYEVVGLNPVSLEQGENKLWADTGDILNMLYPSFKAYTKEETDELIESSIENQTTLATPYDPSGETYYRKDNLCLHDGKVFKCIYESGNIHGTWNEVYWEEVTLAGETRYAIDLLLSGIETYVPASTATFFYGTWYHQQGLPYICAPKDNITMIIPGDGVYNLPRSENDAFFVYTIAGLLKEYKDGIATDDDTQAMIDDYYGGGE